MFLDGLVDTESSFHYYASDRLADPNCHHQPFRICRHDHIAVLERKEFTIGGSDKRMRREQNEIVQTHS